MLLQWYLQRDSYYRLLPLHFPAICLKLNFWLYLAIFHHLCLLMGDLLITSPFLLTKMLTLGAVAVKSTKRKLPQAITTPFSHHSPDISILGHFCPFLAISHHFCLLVGHLLTPSPLLLTKMLSVGAVAMISTKRESYFRLLSPSSPQMTWPVK